MKRPACDDGDAPIRPHSSRSAAIGSSRAARRAGKNPKITPTTIEKPNATATAHEPVTLSRGRLRQRRDGGGGRATATGPSRGESETARAHTDPVRGTGGG